MKINLNSIMKDDKYSGPSIEIIAVYSEAGFCNSLWNNAEHDPFSFENYE